MSAIHTESTKGKNGLPIFVARPANLKGTVPGIVLMHERYGFVQHTQDLAERFAQEGFICAAPDCFFRAPDQTSLHAGNSRYDITDGEAVEHLSQAVDFLETCDEVNKDCIAVKGVCQTGRHPLVLAAHRKIAAALVWYGAAQDSQWKQNDLFPEPLDELIARIDCPVLGMFGEGDHMISLDHIGLLRNSLERHRKSYEIHVYNEAPHGWLNDTMPGRYRRAAAEAALADQRKFLEWAFTPGRNRNLVTWRFSCESGSDYDFSSNKRQE